MTSTTSNPKLSAGRIAAFAGIVCLSMALPIGIIHWSFASAFADKPFGLKSSEQKHYDEGTVKSHELFFGAYRSLDHTGLETFDWRFKRLNLHSGIEEESGLVIPPEWCAPRWVKNELFAISAYATFRMGESSFEEPVTRPGQLSTFHWLLFPYDDRMTAIVDADDGRFQLQHLIDGEWTPGRKILFPGLDHTWHKDSHTSRTTLRASTLQPFNPRAGQHLWLQVRQSQQTTHLLLTDHNNFIAYRSGFELDDDTIESVSALTPENSIREFAGWEQIPLIKSGEQLGAFGCDQQGVLVVLSNGNRPSRIVRRDIDGEWKNVVGFDGMEFFGSVSIIVDSTDNAAYVLDSNVEWSFAAIYRIEGNVILPQPIIAWGCIPEYLARYRRLFGGLLIAWLIHLGILIGGTHFVMLGTTDTRYEFGIQQVALASTWRRAFALILDMLLLISILTFSLYIPLRTFNLSWKPADYKDLCRFLWFVEEEIVGRPPGGGLYYSPSTNTTFIERCIEQLESHPEVISIFVATIFVVSILKLDVEGRFGITPGKWLLGTRTVRSTLRPCGFSQSLLRNAFYCVDILFLVTPIPALISILVSQHRQRLGDRFADTLVVNASSIRDRDDQQR